MSEDMCLGKLELANVLNLRQYEMNRCNTYR